MPNRLLIPIALLTSLLSPFALADAVIKGMNYPVWIERGESSIAAFPGMRVRDGDRVVTGNKGRAWLALEDGSAVKLGQGAQFNLERASAQSEGENSLLDAAFKVVVGAFRFTSGFFAPSEMSHRVAIRVGAITIGIRGTDVWGKAGDGEDFVALLEGDITASVGDAAPVTLDQAMTMFRKQQRRDAEGPQPLMPQILELLSPQTELSAEEGIASDNGRYTVMIMSLTRPDYAESNLRRFSNAHYPVRQYEVRIGEQTFQRLALPGFDSREDAQRFAEHFARQFDIEGVWVTGSLY
jgi:hypothetical protein